VPRVHTHYDNLKVSRDAPIEVIRAAYRSLSVKYHPDHHPDNDNTARIMRIINTSDEIRSNPAKRLEHDRWIASAEREPIEPAPPPFQAEPPRSEAAAPIPESTIIGPRTARAQLPQLGGLVLRGPDCRSRYFSRTRSPHD